MNKVRNINYDGLNNNKVRHILQTSFWNVSRIDNDKTYQKVLKLIKGFKITNYGNTCEIIVSNSGMPGKIDELKGGTLHVKNVGKNIINSFYNLFIDSSNYFLEIVDYDIFVDFIVHSIIGNMSKSNYKIEPQDIRKEGDKIYIDFKEYIPKKR